MKEAHTCSASTAVSSRVIKFIIAILAVGGLVKGVTGRAALVSIDSCCVVALLLAALLAGLPVVGNQAKHRHDLWGRMETRGAGAVRGGEGSEEIEI